MINITTKYNQSAFDISVQEYGSINAIIPLALANNISITSFLQPATILELPSVAITNKEVKNHFASSKQIVASYKDRLEAVLPAGVFINKPSALLKHIRIIANQSLLDIALQETGNLEAIMQICTTNNISVTEALTVGTEINTRNTIIDAEILSYYKNNNLRPATNIKLLYSEQYAVATYVEANYWI
ncbi:MAG: hypothetical protein ACPG6B_01415 [Oceanihabitans sp.]